MHFIIAKQKRSSNAEPLTQICPFIPLLYAAYCLDIKHYYSQHNSVHIRKCMKDYFLYISQILFMVRRIGVMFVIVVVILSGSDSYFCFIYVLPLEIRLSRGEG